MQKNSNRKGLALGAAFAMVASLFVGVAPASANTDGQYIAFTPSSGPVTNFNGILTEDFPVETYLLPGVSNDQFATNKVIFEITKAAGTIDVLVATASAISDLATPASASGQPSIAAVVQAASATPITVSGTLASDKVILNLRAYTSSGIVSSSPSVTLTVKAWVENLQTANGTHDALEWFTTRTIVLHGINSVPVTGLTVGVPVQGDTVLTVSGTVGALNFQNLSGTFGLQVNSTVANFAGGSGDAAVTTSTAVSPANMFARAGVVSQSFAVTQSAGLAGQTSVSANVRYINGSLNFQVGSTVSAIVSSRTAGALSVAVVEDANAAVISGVTKVRANQTYTFRVGVSTGSSSVSGAVVSASITGSGTLATNVKEISIDAGAATTSYPTALSLTTGTDGFATFTLKSSGFIDGDDMTVSVRQGNLVTRLVVQVEGSDATLTADNALLASAAGATTPITFSIEDQWEVASTRTDLRVMITRGGTGFAYAETVSYVAVAAGVASFNFTPTPATKTGSATVTARLQELQTSTNTYVNVAGSANVVVTVNVTDVVSTFSARSVVSQSASISYFPNTVSYKSVAVTLTTGGEAVSVTGPAALIFRQDGTTATASGALTIRANSSGVATLNVASLLEGSHTITFTVGAVSTTSLLIVDAASGSSGVKVAFDKSSITAGETSVITGKVTDANGNPVNTTNTDGTAALVVVSYTGKGLPFNTGSTIETDEKGEFKVNILALPGDVGTGTITATYRPAGAAVDSRNVTATQVITIAAPAAVAAPEINAVIGSFNGRWAVRVENAKGAAVSVKVGGRWVKYTSLNDNYLFSRKSRVGASVAVAVYVNGQLENVATITIK